MPKTLLNCTYINRTINLQVFLHYSVISSTSFICSLINLGPVWLDWDRTVKERLIQQTGKTCIKHAPGLGFNPAAEDCRKVDIGLLFKPS